MPSRTLFTLFAAVAFTLSGCATLFTGTHDDVRFDSQPDGAEIYIDGFYVGETPATVPVRRQSFDQTEVTLKLDGYEPMRFVLRQEFNTVAVLNLGDALGWGIDVATGALMRYDRRGYYADFEEGYVALGMETLGTDAEGRLVVPDMGEAVAVVDEATGLGVVFANR